MKFGTSPEQAWGGLMFYEQIDRPPPLHLRLLLPMPVATAKTQSSVGDEVRCLYHGGHLLKRITRIDVGRHYEFEVIEQNLVIGGGLALIPSNVKIGAVGASIDVLTVRNITAAYVGAGATVSAGRNAWLWKPIEQAVCHMFHRHLLAAIRSKVESDR